MFMVSQRKFNRLKIPSSFRLPTFFAIPCTWGTLCFNSSWVTSAPQFFSTFCLRQRFFFQIFTEFPLSHPTLEFILSHPITQFLLSQPLFELLPFCPPHMSFLCLTSSSYFHPMTSLSFSCLTPSWSIFFPTPPLISSVLPFSWVSSMSMSVSAQIQ